MSLSFIRQNVARVGSVVCLVLSICASCCAQQSGASRLPSQTTRPPAVQTDRPDIPFIVFDRQVPTSIDEKSAATLNKVADTLNNDKKAYLLVVVGDTRQDPCDREVPERAASIKEFFVQKEGVAPERVILMTTPAKEMTAELRVVPQVSTSDFKNLQSFESRSVTCERLTSYRCVHSKAVEALSSGRSLSDKESFPVRQKCGFHLLAGRATYKGLLAESENALARWAPRVHVTVEASPENCSVKYRPVVGGHYLDAGMTTVAADIEPKYYVFECACTVPISPMTVDCTTDRTIKFQCPKPKEDTSNKRR